MNRFVYRGATFLQLGKKKMADIMDFVFKRIFSFFVDWVGRRKKCLAKSVY